MTKQRLNQYRKLIREIAYLQERVDVCGKVHVTDTVRGSAKEFPYIPRVFAVSGYQETDTNVLRRLHERKKKLDSERDAIEEFINGTDDSHVRMILTYRFIHGLSWNAVAFRLGGANTAGGVRMACERFLEKL